MFNQNQVFTARTAQIGGSISVARVLPNREKRMIGAWCFLDHAGPATFEAGKGMRVGPHPHIGLQTFTWMIAGEVLHRDSLGSEQIISPKQVNLMTAGYGISHTEECPPNETLLHAAQLWIALPFEHRNTPPAFDHYSSLPTWQQDQVTLTLLAGDYQQQSAPTKIFSPLIGMDLTAAAESEISLTLNSEFEHGFFVLEGAVAINGEVLQIDQLMYFPVGSDPVTLSLKQGTRVLWIGGKPFTKDVLIWWNYVGHSKEEIIAADNDWKNKTERFGSIANFDGSRLDSPPLPW